MEIIERYRGCHLGLAVGDALGTTLEFQAPGSFAPIHDIVGGGPFGLDPGQWTDDTSMALCLAASLILCKGFDPVDQLQRYLKWSREGYMSCTGECFDIGMTVQAALRSFENARQPYCGSTDPMSAGNGSLMRLAPVPLFYAKHPALAIKKAGESSRTTHGAKEAVDACRYFAALIVGAVGGKSREEILDSSYPDRKLWAVDPLAPRIAKIAAGSYKRKGSKEVRGNGYVVNSLEAALWAFDQSTNFRDGALLAVNLGDDADTTGAIYGQLAGAFYGEQGIPEEWRLVLADRDLIEHFAEDIYSLSLGVLADS